MNIQLEKLQNEFRQKKKIKFLFFWGHRARKDKLLTKSCFSQWWPCSFQIDGIKYSSAEHYMMAEKARLFNDNEKLQEILNANSPAKAKALGRQVKNFDPSLWDKHCFEIVTKANCEKFSQDDDLKQFLINTGNKVLVEASPMDRIWGIGLAESDPRAHNPLTWEGQNLLGFALMEARKIISK